MNTLYLCPSGVSAKLYFENTKGYGNDTLDRYLGNADSATLQKASAELNSLFHMGVHKKDRVVFLSSDTDDGETVARCLAAVLRNNKECETKVYRIKGLQTDDRAEFEKTGVSNLSETIIEEVEGYRYQYNIVLNATAGFKATVPYLTFIGMVFHLPIRYLFERSESIIELPPIPIDFDLERLRKLEPVIDELTNYYVSLEDFRKRTGLSFEEMNRDIKDILQEEEGYVALRPTGKILYQRYLQYKGYKLFYSQTVKKKLDSSSYNRRTFEELFRKMKDPVHLKSKLHPEIKKKGTIDLDCYKAGSTNERIFFYMEKNIVKICDIFMHDEYERALEKDALLKEKFVHESFSEAHL